MGVYRIRVSVEIIDEDDNEIYRYSELVRTGREERVNVIKSRGSADNIVKTISKDVRRACLIS